MRVEPRGGVVCPPAGGWLSETVQYWVIEEGAWIFRDGLELEAALHNTNTVRAGIEEPQTIPTR